MFPAVEKNKSFAERELAIGEFWKKQDIYEKTLAARKDAQNFVFYEGPPTANGMPHPGHCLTRAIKDLFPRYKTMRGYRCERKAGWDTHGLPVEVEVCKELGIHSKEEIEAYGIEPFIQKCQASVWRYMQEWERLTERLGFWVNLEDAYVTYHQSYIESVWWSLKTLFDRGQLYQGHKIVWWWAQGGTALSAGEVGQGYKEVADPSVFVKFPVANDFTEPPANDPTGAWASLAKKHRGRKWKTYFLAWTTTPWTLPCNHFLAVNPELTYTLVRDEDDDCALIMAEDLVNTIADKVKHEFTRIESFSGEELTKWLGYIPPFDNYSSELPSPVGIEEKYGWQVVGADFVTTDAGTGIVHIAPAFGEEDYNVLQQVQAGYDAGEGPELINCVSPNGKFTDEAPEFLRGRWVKDCDKDINRNLKERGLLFHQEQYLHDYPFCWRAEQDPLIQYPRESWFIRTTEAKDQMLANNAEINWLPGHIKDGRFGKFLESNVDWALSRERYWGTPLPIWVCEETGKQEAIGNYDELLAKPGVMGAEVWDEAKAANPELPDDLRVHKPYIDAVSYDSPFADGARMQRVTEVIDCWYDSGAMPFAQWGYRGQESGPEKERFESQFPADFISEAIDQTRGWFYSQLAIGTMLREELGARNEERNQNPRPSNLDPNSYPLPFKNCIVLGLMLSEWFEDKKDSKKLFLTEAEAKQACGAKGYKQVAGKMSKGKRNYRAPDEIFDLYGADALRWYFFANQPPWTSIRYSEQAIKDSIPEFLLRLWNVYSFFTIYANIDEFDPQAEGGSLKPDGFSEADSYRPIAERSELDRWIMSELNATLATVVECMDAYDNYGACEAITTFVDAMSNWYVRRSRDRFWAKDKRSPEKLDAYWTLYECLLTSAKMIAPFVPFLADSLWQKLAVAPFGEQGDGSDVPESVHLCEYPTAKPQAIDVALSEQMRLVREITSLGRQARNEAELKVRQPLAKVEVVLADSTHQAWLESHADLIAEELNVKAVEFTENAEQYIDYAIVPNFKRLGPKLGKNMPKVKKLLGAADGSQMLSEFKSSGKVTLDLGDDSIDLDEEDIEVRLQAKEGWAAAEGRGVVVVLAAELTEELIAEGWMRDLIRVIQDHRKEIGCEFTDRIEIGIVTESDALSKAVEQFSDYVAKETLAVSLTLDPIAGVEPVEVTIGEADAKLYLQVAK